ncbi:hypothetical protein GDO78_013741 [Eleutherodactylus coqui]|uniref:Uncharacterized protein n=1 Tax=Eleutherodactylus coqui TaxID=57060 RepID=A0A8J6E951_ELECQ|nr:hypothetical protein GDO78_013741 [Eleutherodactylus coqui]
MMVCFKTARRRQTGKCVGVHLWKETVLCWPDLRNGPRNHVLYTNLFSVTADPYVELIEWHPPPPSYPLLGHLYNPVGSPVQIPHL